jgi:hypothetical protein
MKFMVLIYSNPESRRMWEGFSRAERTEGLAAYSALSADLVASGELVASEPLAEPAQARRVSLPGGRKLTTDGPFAESKEHLAGFILLECTDMKRALEIAARVPEADLGLVEVRPCQELAALAG